MNGKKTCWIADLGCCDFAAGQDLQERLVAQRRADKVPDILLLGNHPPVVTAGRASTREEIAAARPVLEQTGLPLVECERGGRLTYHSPGQIVGYPILRLEGAERDLHAYLRRLEAVLIAALEAVGLRAQRHPGHTGVWVGGEKIAALGVAVRGWVTWHGFALNLTGDLEPFELINACGIPHLPVTSVAKELGREIERDSLQDLIAATFLAEFTRKGFSVPAAKLL